jgi:hypothetical protein
MECPDSEKQPKMPGFKGSNTILTKKIKNIS